MDEPCSALDPISTAKIEESIHALRERYTIVIVTHNMQQAARVSEHHRVHDDPRGGPARLARRDRPDERRSSARRSNEVTGAYVSGRFG